MSIATCDRTLNHLVRIVFISIFDSIILGVRLKLNVTVEILLVSIIAFVVRVEITIEVDSGDIWVISPRHRKTHVRKLSDVWIRLGLQLFYRVSKLVVIFFEFFDFVGVEVDSAWIVFFIAALNVDFVNTLPESILLGVLRQFEFVGFEFRVVGICVGNRLEVVVGVHELGGLVDAGSEVVLLARPLRNLRPLVTDRLRFKQHTLGLVVGTHPRAFLHFLDRAQSIGCRLLTLLVLLNLHLTVWFRIRMVLSLTFAFSA